MDPYAKRLSVCSGLSVHTSVEYFWSRRLESLRLCVAIAPAPMAKELTAANLAHPKFPLLSLGSTSLPRQTPAISRRPRPLTLYILRFSLMTLRLAY